VVLVLLAFVGCSQVWQRAGNGADRCLSAGEQRAHG